MVSKNSHCSKFLGWVENPRLVVFPKIHILVLPSKSEGMPMAVLEALAAGIPVVATRVGGIPDAIEENRAGIIIDRNTSSLENAINKLLKDRVLLDKLKMNAIEIWKRKFSSESVASKYLNYYNSSFRSRVHETN